MKIKKFLKSFVYAGEGIKVMFVCGRNMKVNLFTAFVVIVLGIIFHISAFEWISCLLCFGLVISLEMINTSFENLVNLVSPDFHPLAKKAKDIAAGAVLVSVIIAFIIGLIIFLPKIIDAIS